MNKVHYNYTIYPSPCVMTWSPSGELLIARNQSLLDFISHNNEFSKLESEEKYRQFSERCYKNSLLQKKERQNQLAAESNPKDTIKIRITLQNSQEETGGNASLAMRLRSLSKKVQQLRSDDCNSNSLQCDAMAASFQVCKINIRERNTEDSLARSVLLIQQQNQQQKIQTDEN